MKEQERVSPPKRMRILLPCVGNKGEYPYYCHRGDALSAGFSELRKDEKKSRRWILTAFLFSSI